MQLDLFFGDRVHTTTLPDKISGHHTLQMLNSAGVQIDLMSVEGIGGQWILKSNRRAMVIDNSGQALPEKALKQSRFYQTYLAEHEESALLYTRPDTLDRKTFTKYICPSAGRLIIGRDSGCDICFASEYASTSHAMLEVVGSEVYVEDLRSSNGTYVNNERITRHHLRVGDVIRIIDLTIVYAGKLFAINNPDHVVRISSMISEVAPIKPAKTTRLFDIEELSPAVMFYRSPRFKRSIVKTNIRIDAPPPAEKTEDAPLLLTIGPSITMGLGAVIMAVVSFNKGGSSGLPFLLMAGIMVGGMILWPILSRRYQKKKVIKNQKLRHEKYSAYLENIRQEITKAKIEQAEIINENYVTIAECISRIEALSRNLWERTEGNEDFLHLRLGIGDAEFEADFRVPDRTFSLEDDEMQSEMFAIAEEPCILHNVPVGVSLLDEHSLGVVGNRDDCVNMMRSLIFQITALHSYDEVKFIFIYDASEEGDWGFVRWLPHAWSNDRDARFIARTPEEARRLSTVIDVAIAAYDQNSDGQTGKLPKFVVFSFDRELASKCEALGRAFAQQEYKGVSVVALYDELRYLPKDCNVVLSLDKGMCSLSERSDTSGKSIKFKPDVPVPMDVNALAIKLANVRLESAEEAFSLPQMITFLELFDVGKVEHLNAPMRWKSNNPVLSLATAVGVGMTGEPFEIDLHEKAHGPHGLIAGSTGSGKSEFIMTFILSLAINYHPNEVAFVLIDYKGGGMANAFAHLPHTVGVITNLDGASVSRSLASIQSELRRRQALFNEATTDHGVSNIDIYKYQGLFREGKVREPLPHLYIISDEFAELKTQQPEFMEQLVSAARIGRSLGVHLILATQKPSGVVDDQIWANSRFKVCLKVQDKSDSMEMIKRPEAAELVEKGRFYLQVGYNELFELGQSAWSGASYIPSDKVERAYDASVSRIDRQANIVMSISPKLGGHESATQQKQLDAVTDYLIDIAKDEHVTIKPLWLEPLSQRMYLSEIEHRHGKLKRSPFSLSVRMGEFDDPQNQHQGPMDFSLSDDGNLLLFGMTGSGKTHFINTLLYSLITQQTPEEVSIYALDFGSEILTAFANAPHVGEVMLGSDSEKIRNFWSMLNQEMARRKKLFLDYGGDYRSYIDAEEGTLPNIIVVINNWPSYAESYEDAEDWIAALCVSGVKYGIYFILTAQTPNSIRYKLQQSFKQQICLSSTDLDDYQSIFGRLEGLCPAQTPGRGLYRSQDGVFEFQAALISEMLADSPRHMRTLCSELGENHKGLQARKVPCLPSEVTYREVQIDASICSEGEVPVGIGKDSLEVEMFDLAKHHLNFVMAKDDAYASWMLGVMRSVVASQSMEVLLVDPKGCITSDVNDLSSILQLSAEDMIAANFSESARLVVIPSFCAIYSGLEAQQKIAFIEAIDRHYQTGKAYFLAGCPNSEFSSISYEPWVSTMVAKDSAVWVGSGFGDQYQIQAQGSFYNEPGKPFGYLVAESEVTIVKMLVGKG